jgi:hypothetical protein
MQLLFLNAYLLLLVDSLGTHECSEEEVLASVLCDSSLLMELLVSVLKLKSLFRDSRGGHLSPALPNF